MRKILVSALLLLSLVIPTSAFDWTAVIDRATKSIVYIETGEGSCTGFVIDATRKLVLTAAHCDDETVWLDLVKGRIVSKDVKKDLAVYEVKDLDPSRPALHLANGDPSVGQEVVSIGYGMGLERPIARKAMISDIAMQIPEDGIGGPFIATDAAFVGGQSGGPVVNSNGDVVMIVQRASGTVGIGVGASIIRERVGRFFTQVKKVQ